MRRFLRLTAFGVLLAGVSLAQTTPTFRSQTELVLVPTVVTDGSRHPLAGLRKEDFTLLQDGKKQSIAVFEEVNSAPSLIQRAANSQGAVTNKFIDSSQPKQVTIIVLDLMRTPFVDQVYFRKQLLSYLSRIVDGNQPIAVVAVSLQKLQVIHDFTSDPKVLMTALKRLEARAPEINSESGSLTGHFVEDSGSSIQQEVQILSDFATDPNDQISDVVKHAQDERTDEYAQQLALTFAGIPGRKAVIWAASAPLLLSGRTLSLLGNAQMAIYPVDTRGLTVPEFDPAQPLIGGRSNDSAVRARIRMNQDIILLFRELADLTGGRAYFNRNDLDNSFQEAVKDSSSYYLLAYYLPKDQRVVGTYKLSVKVNRKGFHARARNGFLILGKDDLSYSKKSAAQLALESPWDFTGIPFTVRWTDPQADEEGKQRVSFEYQLPNGMGMINEAENNHLRLEFTAVALDDSGKQIAESSERIDRNLTAEMSETMRTTGASFGGHLELPAGRYTMRFVIHDVLSDRIGSISAPISIPALEN
jgi:VWFA-related protein